MMLKLAGFAVVLSVPVTLGVLMTEPVSRDITIAPQASLATNYTAIAAPGRVEGATPEIELRPQQAGSIVEILVAEGQPVQEGQALLRMDDDQLRHEMEVAAAEVELAEPQLERLVNGVAGRGSERSRIPVSGQTRRTARAARSRTQ